MLFKPRNILLFHLGALGDFALTWPLALALGRIHPQSRIVYITHASKGALAERILHVESADIEGGWHHLFGDATKLPERALRLLSGAHSIYSFISSPADAWTTNATKLAPAADIVHLQPRPEEPYPNHATDYLLAQLAHRPAVAEAMRQLIRSINDRGLQPSGKSDTILIHPGSGSPAKCWPADRFIDLAGRLISSGRNVRFIFGEAELERWNKSQLDAFSAIAPVARPRDYLDLFAHLSQAQLYIGNDSGPTHLAGILGLKTIALFGPTNPATWKPLGPRADILHRNAIEGITVDDVLAAIAHCPFPIAH